MMARFLALSLVLSFVISPAMAWAERVWDSELKRYLTEQEMSMAEVYLTEEEAIKLMFPKSERIKKDLLRLMGRPASLSQSVPSFYPMTASGTPRSRP